MECPDYTTSPVGSTKVQDQHKENSSVFGSYLCVCEIVGVGRAGVQHFPLLPAQNAAALINPSTFPLLLVCLPKRGPLPVVLLI